MDDASRLPETFLAAVPPPDHREFRLSDRFALRFVGRVRLRADGDHVHRGEGWKNRGRRGAARVLFNSASRNHDGSRRVDRAVACRFSGPPGYARTFLCRDAFRHLADFRPRLLHGAQCDPVVYGVLRAARSGRSQFYRVLLLAARTVWNGMPSERFRVHHQLRTLYRRRIHVSSGHGNPPLSDDWNSRGDVGPGFPRRAGAGPLRRGNQGQVFTIVKATRKIKRGGRESIRRTILSHTGGEDCVVASARECQRTDGEHLRGIYSWDGLATNYLRPIASHGTKNTSLNPAKKTSVFATTARNPRATCPHF